MHRYEDDDEDDDNNDDHSSESENDHSNPLRTKHLDEFNSQNIIHTNNSQTTTIYK